MIALACPDCPTARAARALVLHDGVWSHVWLVAAPYALIALIVVVIVRGIQRHER
ncbi:MAG TPA: hypothetical protein VFP84_13145 [Kofleriaceae bacterium]|nr:hypothetical protein [Kofleriaceae bacterium]